MEYISTTFAHGNGPYSRAIDLALAVGKKLGRGYNTSQIIVPLVYGDRQKRIMKEDFGHIIDQDPDLFLLDPFYGDVLNQILFPAKDYQTYLENLLKNYSALEEKLRNHLA